MVKLPKDKMVKKKYTFIDLFAGCGGLSEGFYRQGFKALAHVEIDHWACETLRTRMKFYGYKDYNREVIVSLTFHLPSFRFFDQLSVIRSKLTPF